MWPISAIWTFLAGDRYELTTEGQQVHQPSIAVPAMTPIRWPRPTMDAFDSNSTVHRTPRPSSALRERYLRRKKHPRSSRSHSPSPEPAFPSLGSPTTGSRQPSRSYRTPAGNPYSIMKMQERHPLPPPFAPTYLISPASPMYTTAPCDALARTQVGGHNRPLISAPPPDGLPSPPYSPAISPSGPRYGLSSATSSSRPAVRHPRTPTPTRVGKPNKENKAPEPRRSSRKPSPKVLPPGVVLNPWNKSKNKTTRKSSLKDKNYVDRITSESPAPSPTLSKPRYTVADKTYRDKPQPDLPTPSPTIAKSQKRRAEEAFKSDVEENEDVPTPSRKKRKPGQPSKKTKSVGSFVQSIDMTLD